MGLLDRVSAALPGAATREIAKSAGEKRFGIDSWITDYLMPSTFGFGGTSYPFGLTQSYGQIRAQEIERSLPGFSAALRRCPPAFTAQMVRATVLSQARFVFRNRASSGTGRKMFGNRDLAVLERPWPNGTTGELIARCEWHAGIAGNAFITNRTPGRLRVLRPDWTAIIWGSESEPESQWPQHELDATIIGYAYQSGGLFTGNKTPTILLPDEVAHWSPVPDPEAAGIGMSWVTPAIREIQADALATDHKIRFFENGATPNLVVKGLQAATPTEFKELVDILDEQHAGVANAYKTLYLGQGADATVVGSDLAQLSFKETQGGGETRIASLSRVHPVILALAEGLAGSSLNAGNFGMARRIWGDTWIYPTLQDLCAALAPLVKVPADSELWFDTLDMPILREDAKDAAEINRTQAGTIGALVDKGFTRESAKAAVITQDMTQLVPDPDWVSVQVQQAGGNPAPAPAK